MAEVPIAMGAWAEIDLAALRHNLARARAAAPASRMLAVIKANGYGHGLVRVAGALSAADGFAVARLSEAVTLREAGFAHPLLLLEGVLTREELELAARLNLMVAVHQPYQLELLEAARLARPIAVWLKLDSGMHRVGFPLAEARAVAQRLGSCASVAAPLHFMTHLARADEPQRAPTDAQIGAFDAALAGLAGPRSIVNSAGLFAWPDAGRDWARPGIMLYGVSPFEGRRGPEEGLRPVMTLKSRLIAVNRLQAGDAIGYGATYTCPEAMPVGVVAIGYGDGYPRHAPSGTPALLNGRRVPLVGRVSMDMITLDLRDQPGARPGDEVTLWGDGLPVEEVAEAAGTIGYELLCGVTGRVPFVE